MKNLSCLCIKPVPTYKNTKKKNTESGRDVHCFIYFQYSGSRN